MKDWNEDDHTAQENEDRREVIVEMAKDEHQDDGTCEIDPDAQTSEGSDNGCYVAAWVWVDFTGTPFDKREASQKERDGE